MKLSILIPALNEAHEIGTTLAQLEPLRSSNDIEVVVADHNSADETGRIASMMGAKVIGVDGGTVASVRNALGNVAAGDVLVFVDADVTLAPGWIDVLQQVAEAALKAGAITGARCGAGDEADWLTDAWFGPLSERAHRYINGGHMIIPRALFHQLGGFAEALASGEDVDFCARAEALGAPVKSATGALAVHRGQPRTLWQFFRREVWHGVGDWAGWGTWRSSRPAMLGTGYLIGLLLLALCLAAQPSHIVVLLALTSLIALPTAASLSMFPSLHWRLRPANVLLCAVYLCARGLSALYRRREGRIYAVR